MIVPSKRYGAEKYASTSCPSRAAHAPGACIALMVSGRRL